MKNRGMEVNYSFDHAIVLVDDLSLATRDYAALDFTVTQGIELANGWLHNAYIAFPDWSYLELLAFKRRWVLPALRILKRIGLLSLIFSSRGRILRRFLLKAAVGKGLVDFMLRSENIQDDMDVARRRGLAIDGPFPANAELPDGEELSWLLAAPQAPDLPFFIAYVAGRDRMRGDRHPNGAEGVGGITVVVTDLDASVRRYSALLGVEPSEGAASPLPEARTMDFALGSATITLAMPVGKSDSLRGHLARRGEGLYSLRLRTSNSANAGTLDLIRTHGTRLELVAE